MADTILKLECATCMGTFTVDSDGEYLDTMGNVCCGVCYCGICGYGHPTADEHENCEAEFEDDGETETVDPDRIREIRQDYYLGV